VDRNLVTVPIRFNFSADADLGNWKLTSIIRPYLVKGGLLITSRTAQATFPAGSLNITYTPCFGFGRGPVFPIPTSSDLPETMETEFSAVLSTKNTQQLVMFITFGLVGGLIAIAIIYNFACYSYKNRKMIPKIEETKGDHGTTNQREQEALLVTQTPPTYQTLA